MQLRKHIVGSARDMIQATDTSARIVEMTSKGRAMLDKHYAKDIQSIRRELKVSQQVAVRLYERPR